MKKFLNKIVDKVFPRCCSNCKYYDKLFGVCDNLAEGEDKPWVWLSGFATKPSNICSNYERKWI